MLFAVASCPRLSTRGNALRNENDGAKEARRLIKRFQEHINSPRLVPDQCYRMASPTYALVCYVNQVTGLYLSKNYPVIPMFLGRAYEQANKVSGERVSEPYRNLVIQYLSHVAHFLVDYSCFKEDEEHLRQFIPSALLEIVPGPLPEDLVLSGEF
jgi:hypothetical protein